MAFKPDCDNDRFIVDTDCGTDDAMAIILALTQCPSQVLAFTCCFGNTSVENVCKNVMKVMVLCDQKNIPIYKGSSGPIITRNKIDIPVHGADGFGDCGDEFTTGELAEEQESAVSAMIRLTKMYPEQITIVALAPLTNLALAHRIDPMFTSRLKSIVCLGGNYKGVGNTTETAEFNFYSDPEAANIFLTEMMCNRVLVPWETTIDYGIEWDEFERLINSSSKRAQFIKRTARFMIDFCRQTMTPSLQDCDVLAMVAALYPQTSIKTSIKREMAVECKGEFTIGMCICKNVSTNLSRNLIEIVQEFNISLLNNLRKYIYM